MAAKSPTMGKETGLGVMITLSVVLSLIQIVGMCILIYCYRRLIKVLPPDTMVWVHKQQPGPGVVEMGDATKTAPTPYMAHLMDEMEEVIEHEVVIRSGQLPKTLRFEGGEYIRTRLSDGQHIYRRCGNV